jgi:YHS domain-containing protein
MTDVILVLNAGSSSIKFSLFHVKYPAESLSLLVRGEIEGIGTQPRFTASEVAGRHLAGHRLPTKGGNDLSHEDALAVLLGWIEDHTAGRKTVAAGHRLVPAAYSTRHPCSSETRSSVNCRNWCRSRRSTNRTTWPRSGRWPNSSRDCPLHYVDEARLTAWVEERLVSFVDTYQQLESLEPYQREKLVTDPVCVMRLHQTLAAEQEEYQGRTCFFCTKQCQQQFAANLVRFIHENGINGITEGEQP